jgi:5-epi-alpha-selinene synthase
MKDCDRGTGREVQVQVPALRVRMSTLVQPFPAVFEPTTAPINRHVAAVEREELEWVQRFYPAIGHHPARLRRLKAAKFPRLAARALPRAGLAELRLVADFISWLFFYDDSFCDRAGATPDPLARLLQAQERMLTVLRGAPPRSDDGPLVHMLADLGARISAWAEPDLWRRFLVDVERYFQSNVWELGNLVGNHAPPGPLYLKMRPYTGGVPVVLDLFELVGRRPLRRAREHALVEQLELLANNAICWANDIGSLGKEMLEGTPHNLVLVLRHDHGLAMEEALARARAMQAAEEAAFYALADQVVGLVGPSDEPLRAHVANLRAFVRGNFVWMQETTRYRAHQAARDDGAAA